MLKVTKRYIKAIQRLFPLYGAHEKAYMQMLREKLAEFEMERAEVSYADLEEEFGTPSEIVADYFAGVDENRFSLKKNMQKLCMVSLMVLVACLGFLAGFGAWEYMREYRKNR